MSKTADISQQREALKKLLAANAYPTIVDVILDGTGRFLQRITRRKTPVAIGFSALAVQLAILLVSILVSLAVGELQLRIGGLPYDISYLYPCWVSLVTIRLYKNFVFDILRNKVLDHIVDADDLADLRNWLNIFSDWKRHLAFSLLVSIVVMVYTFYFWIFVIHIPITWGGALATFAAEVQAGIFVYFIFLLLQLSARLGNYMFDLYPANPSSADVIASVSRLLDVFAYLTTGMIVFVTLVFAVVSIMTFTNILLLIAAGWGPLILLFISNQLTLWRIVRRSKQKTLQDLQVKIKALYSREAVPSKETLEHLRALIDFHDYIKATPNSALDLRAGLNFLNTLLLPLAALVLANLDKLLALLP